MKLTHDERMREALQEIRRLASGQLPVEVTNQIAYIADRALSDGDYLQPAAVTPDDVTTGTGP